MTDSPRLTARLTPLRVEADTLLTALADDVLAQIGDDDIARLRAWAQDPARTRRDLNHLVVYLAELVEDYAAEERDRDRIVLLADMTEVIEWPASGMHEERIR